MRHNISHRKFNRNTNQRKALLCNLANALIEREHILTTLPKAKDLKPIVERMVTFARNKEPLSAYRHLHKTLRSDASCKKLVKELGPRYENRPGGYLRIIKAGFRYGDQAPMAVIEFVSE
jgi:large subunit ribosomal protein L17